MIKHEIIILLSFVLIVFLLSNCSFAKRGGTIPVFMDEFVNTTVERRFELDIELTGQIIEFQKPYDCNNDSILYNVTAIVNVDNEKFTIYIPCSQESFSKDDEVKISPIELTELDHSAREIYKPFPKDSKHYPYWECSSCKCRNTFGVIEMIN